MFGYIKSSNLFPEPLDSEEESFYIDASYMHKLTASVLYNRMKHKSFPDTIYGVIYQPWAFTAVHDGQIDLEPEASSFQAATDALNGWDPTYGCIYYYNYL